MVNIKGVDLDIIRHLYNLKGNETITTYQLAKKIFSDIDISNKRRFYTDKTNYLDYRLEKLRDGGIVEITKDNGRKVYTLILNNVFLKKIRHKKRGIDTTALFLKINKEWECFLDFY